MSAVLAPEEGGLSREDFWELKRLVHLAWLKQRETGWRVLQATKQWQCDGKHPFPNAQIARQGIRPRTDAYVQPYRCRHCGLWHLGADRRRTKR